MISIGIKSEIETPIARIIFAINEIIITKNIIEKSLFPLQLQVFLIALLIFCSFEKNSIGKNISLKKRNAPISSQIKTPKRLTNVRIPPKNPIHKINAIAIAYKINIIIKKNAKPIIFPMCFSVLKVIAIGDSFDCFVLTNEYIIQSQVPIQSTLKTNKKNNSSMFAKRTKNRVSNKGASGKMFSTNSS